MQSLEQMARRRRRYRLGMLCMYKERLRFCREALAEAVRLGDVCWIHDVNDEIVSLLDDVLVLTAEGVRTRRGIMDLPEVRW